MNPGTVRPMHAGDAKAVLEDRQDGSDGGNASLALHTTCGFRVVGVRERVARHAAQNNRWRDVVLLERRSPHVH